jgi:hypothetical protein
VGDGRKARGKPQVKKAAFESTKKKEIGVSDLTLLSKVSNEAINENLKLRFENREIYVRVPPCALFLQMYTNDVLNCTDIYWPCLGLCQPVSRLYV